MSAIIAGLSHGLTLINGSTGTGKTEVAARIITNLLKNHPDQRILLVSSNQPSINTLFNQVQQLTNVESRYLVRLGFDGGDSYTTTEEQLETDKYGRLTLFTSARATLLDIVDKLATSLEILGAHGNSCETATYFYDMHIKTRWDLFHYRVLNELPKTPSTIKNTFPFHSYFNAKQTHLFPVDGTYEECLLIAEGCYRSLQTTFTTLASMRAFEILRTNSDRVNYLVVKEARLVALNSSFALLKRNAYAGLGFTFDTIVYEDAHLMSEVESLFSIQMQGTVDGSSRLKRIVMVGDCDGLKPGMHCALEETGVGQSVFERFVRMGVETCVLENGVRGESEFLAGLYKGCKDADTDMTRARVDDDGVVAGFSFDAQFINVPTFMGMNEHSPKPNTFQNLGEAEYIVAVFMYMRLVG